MPRPNLVNNVLSASTSRRTLLKAGGAAALVMSA